MAPWTGWNEENVRGPGNHLSTPALGRNDSPPAATGFTAINSPQASVIHRIGNAQLPSDALSATSRPERQAEESAKSVVSTYLGRGDHNGTEASVKKNSGPLHGPGTKKKAAAKGKKRTADSKVRTQIKRRKKSVVLDAMPIAKAGENADANTLIGTARQKSNGQVLLTSTERIGIADGSMAAYSAQSISVFAPPTSMGTLQKSTLSTSFQSVKASAGQGTTVYSRQAHPGKVSVQIPVSQSYFSCVQTSQTAVNKGSNPTTCHVQERVRHTFASPPPTVGQGLGDQFSLPMHSHRPLRKDTDEIADKRAPYRCEIVNFKGRNLGDDLMTDDDEILSGMLDLVDRAEAQLNDQCAENPSKQSTAISLNTSERQPKLLLTPEEELQLLADSDDAEMPGLTTPVDSGPIPRSPTPLSRDRKLNLRDVDPYEDCGGALLSGTDQKLLAQLKATETNDVKPVVRKAFPASIRDRTSIFGATSSTILRTCFRVGEALNVGAQAVHAKQNVILEIYARVTSSYRVDQSGPKQRFVLKDLYHDHPPHLEGTYELWQRSALWDYDSRPFLKPKDGGILCRAVARMKRDFDSMKWFLEILSV